MEDVNPPAPPPQDERRPIPGYDGRYEMDRAGNVYATFDTPKGGRKAGRKLSNCRDRLGYAKVTLSNNDGGKQRTIHRLLMLTFCPVENSADLDVNHIDGNKSNNDLSNLEWLTHRDNIIHARRVLNSWRHHVGEVTANARLTAPQVREIRRLFAEGVPRKEIAAMFEITREHVLSIAQRRRWGHLSDE